MVKILDPQYGNDFVGRSEKIAELKEKIKDSGFVVVTGDRGIGKTNLALVVEKALNEEKAGFLKKKPCYHVNGSFFYEEVNRIFAPSKRLTGVSGSVSTPIAGAGGGLSWDPREPFILEYMEKSKDKIVFVENAHELKKEDFETILEATRRNDRLRFVLEIATPYLPDVTIRPGSYEVVQLSELSEDAIEQIVRKECPGFSDAIVHRIVALSKGYPYVARSLAYICDNKDSEEEIAQFLQTLRDADMEHNLDRIHKKVLETLNEGSREVIKSLAIAPATLTLNLIAAFCGDDVDPSLTDLIERGILVTSEEKIYRIYHPLFRAYLRSIQPVAFKTKQKIYSEALEKVKDELDSVIILLEVLDEPFFESLLKQTENYKVLNSVGIQAYTWGKTKQALCVWRHLHEEAKDVDKNWEANALGNSGLAYRDIGENDKALEYFKNALELHEKLGLKDEVAKGYGNISNIYRTKGKLSKALEFQKKALELDEKLNRKEGIAGDLGNMGLICRTKGKLDKALEYHEKSLKLNEELGRKEGMANQLGNIGIVYKEKGELGKALKYYQKALKLNEQLGRKKGIAINYANIGIVYLHKGEFEKALEYSKRALKLDEAIGYKEGFGINLANIGNAYLNQGELNKALEYCENALEIFKGVGSRIETAQTLGNIGEIFIQKGDKERALEYYREAKPLAEGSSVFEIVSKRLEELEEGENRNQ
ncbi:MAG: tetratricopeptide repeat protein [Methanomicrobia archaeon]|nr:tetratricopeptide repeat protein [Methanomicrobia archaeon]